MMNLGRFASVARTGRVAGVIAAGLGAGLPLSACGAGAPAAVPSAVASAAFRASSGPAVEPSVQTPVLFGCQGRPEITPATYPLGCNDALNDLDSLKWTSWGKTAAGTATEKLDGCVPSCAARKPKYYSVSVRLGDLVTSKGRRTYSVITVSYAGTAPAITGGETDGRVTRRTAHSWTATLSAVGG